MASFRSDKSGYAVRSRLIRALQPIRTLRKYVQLPAATKAEHRRDLRGLPTTDPGIERTVEEALDWLARAQDNSASGDGGVARHYALIGGWSASYPETPTVLACAASRRDDRLRARAERMLDFLVSLQFADGSFPGGVIGQQPRVAVTFIPMHRSRPPPLPRRNTLWMCAYPDFKPETRVRDLVYPDLGLPTQGTCSYCLHVLHRAEPARKESQRETKTP